MQKDCCSRYRRTSFRSVKPIKMGCLKCSITNKVLTTHRLAAPNKAAVHVIRIKQASDNKTSESAR